MKLRPMANPPNPYLSVHAEWLEPPPVSTLEVMEDHSKSILSRNDSPDLPFTWSANPYRGCQHACSYCYARPYHEYLGYGAGTDFDTKIIAKPHAGELLDRAFSAKHWQGEAVNFSGVTDCYQPIEASLQIMRQCLQVCLEHGNPVGIVTKGYLVVRDIDLLVELNEASRAIVYVSVPLFDQKIAATIEPQAPPPMRRIEAIRRLREAGIPAGVMVAPIIPGLGDRDIPNILEAAAQAGAKYATCTALRLTGSVEPVFVERLRAELPLHAERVLSRLKDIRGGRFTDTRFGERMHGRGVYWDSVRDLFKMTATRLGLRAPELPESMWKRKTAPARRATGTAQPDGAVRTGADNPASGQVQGHFDFPA